MKQRHAQENKNMESSSLTNLNSIDLKGKRNMFPDFIWLEYGKEQRARKVVNMWTNLNEYQVEGNKICGV